MSSSAVSIIRKLSAQNITVHEKNRIAQVILDACRGDPQMAALTGGRVGFEPALVHSQIDLCISQGEIYVAGQGENIDGVLLAYSPGQDIQESFTTLPSPVADYVSMLSPEMQQWWTSHFMPKFSELASLALGSHEGRKSAWYIRTIAVHPDKQRRGIGRQLMNTIIEEADASSRKICLEVNSDGTNIIKTRIPSAVDKEFWELSRRVHSLSNDKGALAMKDFGLQSIHGLW